MLLADGSVRELLFPEPSGLVAVSSSGTHSGGKQQSKHVNCWMSVCSIIADFRSPATAYFFFEKGETKMLLCSHTEFFKL